MSAGTLGSTSTTAYVGGGGNVAKVGNTTTDTVSFYGVSGSTQRTSSAQTTVVVTVTASGNGFGFATSAGFLALVATVNEIQATLTLLGLWKGS